MSGRTIRILIGVVISAVAIYVAIVGVDYTSVWGYLVRADLTLIGLALASIAVNNVAKALRWKLLLGDKGTQVSLWYLLQLHLVGQMINQLMPGRVGDVSRIYLAGEIGVARSFVLGTVALEKIIDMTCYVLIFALLLALIPLPTWVSQSASALVVTTLIVLVSTGVMIIYRRRFRSIPGWLSRWLPTRLRDRIETIIHDALESLAVLSRRNFGLHMTVISAIIWFTAALTNYLVLWALRIEAPAVSGLLVLFVLLAGINIASVPGQIGVFEYLCVLSLAIFGIDQAPALSFGVLLHVLTYVPTLIAGVLALWGNGPAARSFRHKAGEVPPG